MRQSILEYSKLTLRLFATLDRAMQACEVFAGEVGWGKEDGDDLAAGKAVLPMPVPIAHPSPLTEVCLYTVANQAIWSASSHS